MTLAVCPTSFYPSCTAHPPLPAHPLGIVPLPFHCWAVSWRCTNMLPPSVPTSYLPCMTFMPFYCRGLESPGGAMSGLPAHAYDMYIMPPSPMTPMMHSHPGQQQRQQQLQQCTPPYRMRHDQLNSPGMDTLISMYVLHLTMLT